MPGSTPNRSYPYPLGSEPAAGDDQIEALARALDTDVAGAVRKAGDTMTGHLVLVGDGSAALHPVTIRQWDQANDDLENEIDATANTINALLGGKKIIAGSTVTAVSGSGGITQTYGFTFAATPIFVAVLGDETSNAAYVQVVHSGTSTTHWSVRVRDASNAAVPSGTFRINWVAIGTPP